ncbi:MAG: histidine phosphatase family protein [Pirellulaceae bacterium]|jgi:phosphoserine phosphatase|nr:histidine phosphatase family protein [Pirellulaceae bacterium]
MNIVLPSLLLIRTGATELDHQGRICGNLDVPLCEIGLAQARETASALADRTVSKIYRAPCLAAAQTAEVLAKTWRVKIRMEQELENVNFGLWHGRQWAELKTKQPRLYKSWTEHPETVCPPGGEPICDVQRRIVEFLKRISRKPTGKTIAIVASPAIAAIICSEYQGRELREVWACQCADGTWLELAPPTPQLAP